MVMAGAKRPGNDGKPLKSYADVADKLMAEIDPEVMMAGMLGAVATAGGITPPLTRLLDVLTDKDITDDIAKALEALTRLGAFGLGPAGLMAIFNPPSADASAQEKEDYARRVGLMAAGAMEGMMMMTLMKNKQLMSQIMDTATKIASATISAAGEAVPF